jgi:hypothetical protein
MIKLIIRAAHFQVGPWILPKNGTYKYKVLPDDRVGLTDSSLSAQYLVNPIHFSQWVNEADVPFASLENLLHEIDKSLNSYDAFLADANLLVDYNLTQNDAGINDNANVNGSLVAPIRFESIASKDTVITEFRIYIEDNANFDDILFGGLPALPNGCLLVVDNVVAGLFKTNKDLVLRSSNSWNLATLDSVNRNMVCQRLFKPYLSIKKGASIQFIVRDNLTGLVRLHFGIRGFKL